MDLTQNRECQLLLAALHALTPESPAATALTELCERYGLKAAARVAEDWLGA